MNDTKNEKKAAAAQAVAEVAKEEAKTATGWWAYLWKLLAAAAAFAAGWYTNSCTPLTHEQMQQVQAAHGVYHAVTGQPCVFKVDSDGK